MGVHWGSICYSFYFCVYGKCYIRKVVFKNKLFFILKDKTKIMKSEGFSFISMTLCYK